MGHAAPLHPVPHAGLRRQSPAATTPPALLLNQTRQRLPRSCGRPPCNGADFPEPLLLDGTEPTSREIKRQLIAVVNGESISCASKNPEVFLQVEVASAGWVSLLHNPIPWMAQLQRPHQRCSLYC
uniref:Uncharacterized protein n=1 Tax=Setaria viridis TaxID=4556 RepID=A0A4U6VR14_SETVI|nr:hypothetical protein SEVIR_2G157818v2 [Setaria viridis]